MKKYEFSHNEVVIGGSLESLLFSCIFHLPIILIEQEEFSPIEKVHYRERRALLKYFGDMNGPTLQYTQANPTKQFIYDYLCFISMMRGHLFDGAVVKSVRYIENENRLSVVTESNKQFYIEANNYYVFNVNDKLKDFPQNEFVERFQSKSKDALYSVCDYFKTKRVRRINIDYLKLRDGISERIVNGGYSKIYLLTKLTKKDLDGNEYIPIVLNKYLMSVLKPYIERYADRHLPKLNHVSRIIKRVKSDEKKRIGNFIYDDREFQTILSVYKRANRPLHRIK